MTQTITFLVLIFSSLSYGQLCSSMGADQYIISSRSGDRVSRPLVLTNASPVQITVQSFVASGTGAALFELTLPATPTTVASMATLNIPITFAPTSIGVKTAQILITLSNGLTATVLLRGLSFTNYGGTNEPSLQWIFDTFQFPINVGDDNPANNIINSNVSYWIAETLGDELPSDQLFMAVDPSQPIMLTVLATWGPQPQSTLPVCTWGWYVPGDSSQNTSVFSVANPSSQTLWPTISGNLNFTVPLSISQFGIFSTWPFFAPRGPVTSQNSLNTWDNGYHHLRTYRYKDRNGNAINGTLILATEEWTSDKDFNDVVVVASNLKLASDPVGFGMGVTAPSTQAYCWPTVMMTSTSSSTSGVMNTSSSTKIESSTSMSGSGDTTIPSTSASISTQDSAPTSSSAVLTSSKSLSSTSNGISTTSQTFQTFQDSTGNSSSMTAVRESSATRSIASITISAIFVTLFFMY